MPLRDGRETPEEYAERQRRNAERAQEREQRRLAWEERQRENERKHQEYLQRQQVKARKHEEFLQRQRERERKNEEWQQRQRERERERQQQHNISQKKGLILRANANADTSNWKEGTSTARELQEKWREIKYCGEDEDRELISEFRRHIQKFFDRRTAYFQDLEAKQAAAFAERERIISKAKSLSYMPVDWENVSASLANLKKEFVGCGPYRKEDYESLWGRLNDIISSFHKEWKAHREAQRLIRQMEWEQRRHRSANWPGARFARDVAVNPTPAAALSTARPVGRSSTQNEVKDKWVSYMEQKGYEDIRVNQRQVTGEGVQVGINRPDLSGNGPHTGDRLNAEFETSKSNRGPEHERRIYANDPKARVFVKKAD